MSGQVTYRLGLAKLVGHPIIGPMDWEIFQQRLQLRHYELPPVEAQHYMCSLNCHLGISVECRCYMCVM